MNLDAIRAMQASADDAGALHALDRLSPGPSECAEAAALALALGRPRLAAHWAQGCDPLLQAAALLRLGEVNVALKLLEGQPASARVSLLRARARGNTETATVARALARQEGDSPALIAAATLLGELLLPSDLQAALRALAEGLKVSEMLRTETDAHLLAVLSVVQRRIGGTGKALRTAQKALERSLPRSPGRVIALLSLGRRQEAEAEREAGQLALDIQPFLHLTPE